MELAHIAQHSTASAASQPHLSQAQHNTALPGVRSAHIAQYLVSRQCCSTAREALQPHLSQAAQHSTALLGVRSAHIAQYSKPPIVRAQHGASQPKRHDSTSELGTAQ
jgi:hypothetical protein